jgi:phosphate:Na+ symporter
MSGTELLLTLLGGVALLLWGVRMIRTGLTRAFGATLRAAISRASHSRLTAFAAGAGVAGVLQSSTATVILVSSFLERSLFALPVALAIVLGADVGTTLVAQVFALNIKWVWTLAMLAGVVAFHAARDDRVKSCGRIAIGFGLTLLALTVLGTVSEALRASPTVEMVLAALAYEPTIAVLVAAGLTWLAHSSLAIILFVASLAGGGVITPQLAFALVIGVNIGGAIAPLTALLGAPAAARRLPVGNLVARAAVGILAIPALAWAARIVPAVSLDAAHAVLNFHVLFNVVVALLFVPLLDPLARFVTWWMPEPAHAPDRRTAQHLDPSVLDTPAEALACAMRETLNVGNIVLDMLRRSLAAIEGTDPKLVKEIERADDEVDALHEAIKLYLIRASKGGMSEEESRRYVEILTFTTNLEHIGDIIDKNLMELAAKKIRKRFRFSSEGLEELKQFHEKVVDNMRLALNVFATHNVELARRLLLEKTSMRNKEFDAAERHFARLKEGRLESIETSAIHLDIIRDLKRINSHLTSVAYPILEAAGELRDTRLRSTEPAPKGAVAVTGGSKA